MSIHILNSIAEVRKALAPHRRQHQRIGFVPTMGYLHEGHLSLIRKAREECDIVVVSIFVNPTQFGPSEDYEKYPRDLDRDTSLAESVGTDYLFVPSVEELYPAGFQTWIEVTELSKKFEGVFRPHHFKGVTTIVGKLFNIVLPDKAYFGQKDYQQYLVIRRMVEDLHYPITIVLQPTIREQDGLAMSSRNVYLSPEERKNALCLYQALLTGRSLIEQGERNRWAIEQQMQKVIEQVREARIDYVAVADAETLEQPEKLSPGMQTVLLIAVRFPSARLIDNMLVKVP